MSTPLHGLTPSSEKNIPPSPSAASEREAGSQQALTQAAQDMLSLESSARTQEASSPKINRSWKKKRHSGQQGEMAEDKHLLEQQKVNFAATTAKTEQVGASWWKRWGENLATTFKAGMGYSAQVLASGATHGIQWYAESYHHQLDKASLIAASKRVMLENLNEPQFVELYDFVKVLLLRFTQEQMATQFQDEEGFVAKNLLPQRRLILDLMEINLAKGFANLAQQVKQSKDQLPHADHQPALLHVLLLLSQRVGTHVEAKCFAKIEEKYRQAQEELPLLSQKMFPDFGSDVAKEEEEKIKGLIQEYIQTTNPLRRSSIEYELFPDINEAIGRRAQEIRHFIATLYQLHMRHEELQVLFSQMADDILIYLFPNKFADMQLPYPFQGKLGEALYNFFIKDLVVKLLQEIYEPIGNCFSHQQAWQKNLQAKTGVPQIQTIVEAPSALFVALVKHFIQSDPRVVTLIAGLLENTLHPQTVLGEANRQKEMIAQLSQEQLANWIVATIQAMLHTDDPHLLGVGHFIQQGLNNLFLACMSKGATLVIPEGETIKEDQFIKVFLDRMIAKFITLTSEEEIQDQFWEEFVHDLPLPSFFKGQLIAYLSKSSQRLQMQLKQARSHLSFIQQLNLEAEQKMRGYENGQEFLQIIESVSEEIIQQALEQNVELVATLGWENAIEELFAQFLPSVKVDEDLKNWFKANVHALKTASQPINLLKQAIRAVLCQAFVRSVETNFKGNDQNYAAQLLKNLHQAFFKALQSFDTKERERFHQALVIQEQIQTKENQLELLKSEIADQPKGLTPDQVILLEKSRYAHLRYLRAVADVKRLEQKRDGLLARLNQDEEKLVWTVEHLSRVGQALVLYKMHKFSEVKAGDFAQLASLLRADEVKQGKILFDLLNMPSDKLQCIMEAMDTEATLQHAQKERAYLEREWHSTLSTIEQHDLGKLNNRSRWDQATAWLDKSFKNQQAIKTLSEEITQLEKDWDEHLQTFRFLSQELSILMGIDQKESLQLPAALQELVWPLIESAKKRPMTRFLFKQIAPILLPVLDIEKNRAQLSQLAKGNQFLAQLANGISTEIVGQIPAFITSYQPFAKQLLALMGNKHPSMEEVTRMEMALQHRMIELGRQGISASMIQPMLQGMMVESNATSKKLANLITHDLDKEISADQIFSLLKEEEGLVDAKEEKELLAISQKLAKHLHHFLLRHGKNKLLPADLVQVVETQVAILHHQTSANLESGKLEKLVDKIKKIAITPEEIVDELSALIPEAKRLKLVIAKQLQEVLTGEDQTFSENRKLVQRYIEGVLLGIFVKIASSNSVKDQEVLVVLTRKLQQLISDTKGIEDQNPEEVAHAMVDQLLEKVLGITSEKELEGIPPFLRGLGYEKLKEQAYQQLTPIMLSILERAQTRHQLAKLSGSQFLGHLARALSQDLFSLLPAAIKSYRPIARELYILLSGGQEPNPTETHQLAQKIATLVAQSKDKNITHHALVAAYAEIAHLHLTPQQQAQLQEKLNKRRAKEEIKTILLAPEDIEALVGEEFPHLGSKLQQTFAQEIQSLIHESPEVYDHVSAFVGAYVEGVLLKFFLRMAQKNPAQRKKDTLVVVTEKLLDFVTKKYAELRSRPFEEVAHELNEFFIKDTLGLDSLEALEGLPDPLKDKAYSIIQSLLEKLFVRFQQGLSTLNSNRSEIQNIKEEAKKFGIEDQALESYAQILAQDLAHLVMDAVPKILTDIRGQKLRGIHLISKGVETYLEELAQGQLEVAKVLLHYAKAPHMQALLEAHLTQLAASETLMEDKQKASELLSHLILIPLSQAFQRAVEFEKQKGAEFNQALMANLFHVAADHLKNLHHAKEQAKGKGHQQVLYQDYVESVGEHLHPAVPQAAVDYQASLTCIRERLYSRLTPEQERIWNQEQATLRLALAQLAEAELQGVKMLQIADILAEIDKIHLKIVGRALTRTERRDLGKLGLKQLIRQEADALRMQQQKEAFIPATKAIMKMLFPHGKRDLTYVSPDVRGQVWKMYKTHLFPAILSLLTELILDPDVINQIALTSLETLRDSLRPLHEQSIESLLNMYKKGGLIEKTTGQPAIKVFGKVKAEDLMQLVKQGKVVAKPTEPEESRPFNPLDEAAGALILEILQTLELPDWVKKQMLTPKGKISPSLQQALTSVLKKQFHTTFLQEKLELALEKMTKRDQDGHPFLWINPTPNTAEESDAKRQRVRQEFGKVAREVVDGSISYFIRSKWEEAQARFDTHIQNVLGQPGLQIKQGLDAVFGFIFFKIVGTLLSILFSPVKKWLKNKIYDILSLDENREILMKLWSEVPADQPFKGKYVGYHEDFIFKAGEALAKTVEEFMDKEPVFPQPTVT